MYVWGEGAMLCLQQLVADEMPTDGFIYAAQSVWAASSRRVELIESSNTPHDTNATFDLQAAL